MKNDSAGDILGCLTLHILHSMFDARINVNIYANRMSFPSFPAPFSITRFDFHYTKELKRKYKEKSIKFLA